MSRILLCWEQGNDFQHLLSMQPIARFYIDRGHDVWVAGKDVSKLKRLFLGLNIHVVAAPHANTAAELGVENLASRSYADFLRRCGYQHSDALEGLVSAWKNLYDFIQPDLLLLDQAPTALLAARGLKKASKSIPKVAIGMAFSIPDDNRPAGIFFPGDQARADVVRYEDDVVKNINKVCLALSIPRIDNLAELFLDIDQCIFQTHSELDHYGYRSAVQRSSTVYTGAVLPEFSEPAVFPHFKGPKIYCHVKGSAETSILLKTLQAIECSAIVLVDGIPESIVKAHQSRHILYVNQPLNMQDVLDKASFAILNGGVSGVSLFLRSGIPVALFPLHIEQFLMAKRVEALNAGVQLNLSSEEAALKGLQKLSTKQKKIAAGLFEEKYREESPKNNLLLQLALVEQSYLV